jgi:hypothetical protein
MKQVKRVLLIVALIALLLLVCAGWALIHFRSLTIFSSLWWRTAHFQSVKRDTQRVMGLREARQSIVTFYEDKGILPEHLNILAMESLGHFNRMIDPLSHEPYAYRALSDRETRSSASSPQSAFELCAVFEAPSVLIEKNVTPLCRGMCLALLEIETINPITPEDKDFLFWEHGKGYNCWRFGSDGEFRSGIQTGIIHY